MAEKVTLSLNPKTLAWARAAAQHHGFDRLADKLESGWSDLADAA